VTSATASLPDLGPALDAASNAQTGLSGFLQVAGALAGGGAASPLNAVTQALGGLQGALDIDVSGLAQRLPLAISTIHNALPADSLQFIDDLQGAYQALNDFLANNALVRQIQPGNSLEQTALALVDQVLAQFSTRLASLGSSLIDADTLAQVSAALATLEQLAAGQPPAAGALVEFLAQQLIGIKHDLLDDARNHLDNALALAQPLDAATLDAALAAPRQAVASAFNAVLAAVHAFDASDAAAYPALEALLQAWSGALDAAFSVLQATETSLLGVINLPAWDGLFAAYAAVLAAIPLDEVPTVDDAVDALAGLLESLLSRLGMALSPQDLAAQVARSSAAIHDLFAQSALSQVRQILIDFIGRIQQAVEAIPSEAVQQAVTGMLTRVHQALDSLGIAQVRSGIAAGFQSAHDFIDQHIENSLLAGVSSALDGALAQFNSIPIADLGQALADAVAQAGTVITDLETNLSSALDDLKGLLAQLDGVDFRPVADEVVDEIDALKAKLAAIKPESISDAEKFALQAGLTLLRAIDLETMVEEQLKKDYASLDEQLTQGVQTVLDAWLEFRNRIGGFDGAALAGPVLGLIDQVGNAVKGVNGTLLLRPLDDLLNQLLGQLQALSPGALLDPLKAPYQTMMQTLDRVNPDVWVQPLRALHVEIDRLVTLIDITPLLDALEQKERTLFTEARNALAASLDSLHLPAPLDSFLDTVKVLVLGLTDAVFGDPDGSLRQFNLQLAGSVRPSSLFKPLDDAFDRLLAAVNAQPAADVLAALDGVRSGLGAALPVLNPAAVLRGLRQAQAGLASLSPAALPGVVTLPGLRAQINVKLDLSAGNGAAKVSLQARFDGVLAPLDLALPASRLRLLDSAHQALVTALRLRINRLDSRTAQAAYDRLDANLGRLLPAFLRQAQPLTMTDVTAGLAALRPSVKARRLDLATDRFLAELKPLQAALDGSVNGFFQEVRNAALVLHPAGLKTAVAGVYAALRSKLNLLDPDQLAADLRTSVWDPLTDPLRAIDPAAIALQLDSLYQSLLAKLSGAVRGLLSQIRLAIDAFLVQVRQALKAVLDALKVQIEAILAGVSALLQQLDALVVDELFGRLLSLLDNLETSFNQQLDRVRNEFDAMLDAIPLASASEALAV